MRQAARACAPVVVWVVALALIGPALTGCASARRPDAEVARTVELAERQREEALVALASADDDALPVALPAGGGMDDIKAGADESMTPGPTTDLQIESFAVDIDLNDPILDSVDGDGENGEGPGKDGRPRLGLNIGKFTIAGRPVSLRASIKRKFLMFGAKIKL